MLLKTDFFKKFLGYLRCNLSVTLLITVVMGAVYTVTAIVDKQIASPQYSYLMVIMAQHVFLDFLRTGLLFAIVFSFIFALRKKALSDSSLLLQEGAVLIVGSFLILGIKRYFVNYISGFLVYSLFDISRFLQSHLIFAVGLFLFLFFLAICVWKTRLGRALVSWQSAIILFTVLLLFQAFAITYGYWLKKDFQKRKYPNVIVITLDALRADHLSYNGYLRDTSPQLDEWKKQCVIFKNAIAPYTKTSQSFAGLFTGKQTYATGIDTPVASYFPSWNLTLSEILRNQGYRTVGITSNANLATYFNFNQGFDEYYEMWRKQKGPAREKGLYDADKVTAKTVQWLSKNVTRQPFFLWIHYMDPHTTYAPPAPYNSLFVNDAYSSQYADLPEGAIKDSVIPGSPTTDPDYYIAQYDGEIRNMDKYLGLLFEKIDELGLSQNTFFIVTADHGESMTGHDYYFDHGKYAYDDCARVPLLVRFAPKTSPNQEILNVVSTIDLLPTLLDFLEIKKPAGIQGYSLKPLMTKGEDVRPHHVFLESNTQLAVRTEAWKLIGPRREGYSNQFELYNLKDDPDEKNNLYGKGYNEQKILEPLLQGWWEKVSSSRSPRKAVKKNEEVAPEIMEQLKSLGYVN